MSDEFWNATRGVIVDRLRPGELVCGPNAMLADLPATCHYHVTDFMKPSAFRLVALHKGMLSDLNREFLNEVVRGWHPVFANEVFVVFDRDHAGLCAADHLQALYVAIEGLPSSRPRPQERDSLIVTTCNRASMLRRTLPAAVSLGVSTLVVDDGSPQEAAAENRALCADLNVDYLSLPSNRGLSSAMNAGLGYWLADPNIGWITIVQDDVLLDPTALERLALVRDVDQRPLLTPYLAPEHPVHKYATVAGTEVSYQRATSGQALHAHRDYWSAVMPIPTAYLGAPKPTAPRPGQGSDADWWITAWSPGSVAKRGLFVTCLPGLATHLAVSGEDSTWRHD